MKQKVVDVLAPGARKEKKEKEYEILEEEVFETGQKPAGNFWKLFFSAFFVILLVSTGVIWRLTKVNIRIWPVTEDISLQEKLVLSVDRQFLNFEEKTVPAQVFTAEENFSSDFPATGEVMKKAEGVIKLYNGFTTEGETWKEGTRFVSSDGKIFKSKGKISVPPAELKNGKIVPSSVDVPVIASEAGQDYNIGPSSFSIAAYRGTARYTKFYGESADSMTGGGKSPQVTSDDIEKAEKNLAEKVKNDLKIILKNKLPSDYVFAEDLVETKILEKSTEAKAGSDADKFTYKMKAKASVISFKSADISDFVERYIISRVSDNMIPLDGFTQMDFSPDSLNYEENKFAVSLNVSARIYPKINSASFKELIKSKSLNETRLFISGQEGVKKVEFGVFPPWLENIPKETGKIKIEYPIVD